MLRHLLPCSEYGCFRGVNYTMNGWNYKIQQECKCEWSGRILTFLIQYGQHSYQCSSHLMQIDHFLIYTFHCYNKFFSYALYGLHFRQFKYILIATVLQFFLSCKSQKCCIFLMIYMRKISSSHQVLVSGNIFQYSYAKIKTILQYFISACQFLLFTV